MLKIENVSRRDALKGLAVGTGLVLAGKLVAAPRPVAAATGAARFEPNVFVAIAPDGTVTLTAHRSEMGQGIRTSLAQLLADELEADWTKVRVEQAPGDVKYGDQYTDGSRSVVLNFDRLRQFGAVARTMLVEGAAKQWGVPASECRAENHQVLHAASGRAIGYGELVEVVAGLPAPDPATVQLKDRKDWRYIGKPVRNVDLADIVRGRAIYGIDVRVPGMKYASIERCPVHLGRVRRFDATETLKVPGVERVVEIPPVEEPVEFKALGGIAVIATNTWAAVEGRKKLQVEWDGGPNASFGTAPYREALEATAAKPGDLRRTRGDVGPAFASAAKVVEAAYWSPHFVHAPMEVPSATADVRGDQAEVWGCSQDAQALQKYSAAAIGMDPAKVTARVTLLGGAFGRKSKPDFGAEAAFLSKAIGAPVKVTWTREDDVRNGYYHACAAQTVRCALDADGRPTAWEQRSVFPSIMSIFVAGQKRPDNWELDFGLTDLPYDVPNVRIETGEAASHVRVGWKRSVQNIFHAFAIGSFADELAVARGKDPVENLIELIGPARTLDLAGDGVTDYFNYSAPIETYPIETGRLSDVVKLAAAKAGWKRNVGERRAMGIAAHRSFLTYVATIVEAEVGTDGTVSIPRVVMAVDAGTVVNPDRVIAQMESACIYAMSAAFFGEITAEDGRVRQHNFDDYPVARQSTSPRVIEVHLVDSTAPPGGVGEPGVPPFAPALCNAIFAATGVRVRSLPIRSHDLKAA